MEHSNSHQLSQYLISPRGRPQLSRLKAHSTKHSHTPPTPPPSSDNKNYNHNVYPQRSSPEGVLHCRCFISRGLNSMMDETRNRCARPRFHPAFVSPIASPGMPTVRRDTERIANRHYYSFSRRLRATRSPRSNRSALPRLT